MLQLDRMTALTAGKPAMRALLGVPTGALLGVQARLCDQPMDSAHRAGTTRQRCFLRELSIRGSCAPSLAQQRVLLYCRRIMGAQLVSPIEWAICHLDRSP